MTRRLDWAEYRTTEYDAIDPDRTIAILPTAAIEAGGPGPFRLRRQPVACRHRLREHDLTILKYVRGW